ncbi:molybdate ABC transporter substrate-binding protein [Salmonella enterica subsp. enterica]|nr:molybdate ABC transporter substrate-binding protein [Salmonella enterica subsp. enterica]
MLRERIEAGEACDFFASANLAHPQALLESGRALWVAPFTTNRLCLSVRAQAMREGEDWLSLLTRRDLRIGTSTAGCDPSGDYTQQLFSRMGKEGEAVRKRAVALVGGRQTLPLPAGRLAAEWLINHDTPISLSAMPAMLPGYGWLIRCEWLISRNLIIPWLNMALPA